jgi:hypothetical protein
MRSTLFRIFSSTTAEERIGSQGIIGFAFHRGDANLKKIGGIVTRDRFLNGAFIHDKLFARHFWGSYLAMSCIPSPIFINEVCLCCSEPP